MLAERHPPESQQNSVPLQAWGSAGESSEALHIPRETMLGSQLEVAALL